MVERNKSFQIAANVIMILLSAMCIVPFILLIMSSITKENILLKYGYSFWPREISFDAYKTLLVDSGSIVRGYIISALVTVVGTVANLTLTTLFAYPLSRKELPGKAFFSFVIFFTMLFNGGLVPSYMMWTGIFHIKNTIWALIVPNLLMGAFYVIMMRTYFTTNIPDAVIEAARIDGAGRLKTIWYIIIPMLGPILKIILMLAITSAFHDITNVMVLTEGGPTNSTMVMSLYLPSFCSRKHGAAVRIWSCSKCSIGSNHWYCNNTLSEGIQKIR